MNDINELKLQFSITEFTRSFKTAIYGTFVRRMRKDVRHCFNKKIMTSAVVEIRVAF